MGLLVVGSVALDSVETPFGRTENAVGGSAVFFGVAGSLLHPVWMVGVVGRDYPMAELQRLAERGLDLRGVTVADGESFRWAGKYGFDLSTRDTLETRLGVFANFRPVIPEAFRDAQFVFLGNIDPELQLEVLEQVRRPRLVACDTMNYWIQGKRTALLKLLEHVDVLLVNDSEVRELSGDWHIHRAARWVLEHGPRYVVVKKGEHGAVLVQRDRIFYVPAFPLDDVFDPTGAGDAFAGGFMAHLARTGDLSEGNLRLAMVYGSAMGSFAVERFSVGRFEEITLADVRARVHAYRDLVHFELDAAPDDAGRR
jgi:sugar/nucleoside kinase (ribokinase family)